jgi:AcrR family transcriptional regulator
MPTLRDKILATATNLFQTQGINSTGVDNIVAAAGTTKMTLYKYFRSKELLILEVLTQSQQQFQTWLNSKLDSQTQQPAEKIQAVRLHRRMGQLARLQWHGLHKSRRRISQ